MWSRNLRLAQDFLLLERSTEYGLPVETPTIYILKKMAGKVKKNATFVADKWNHCYLMVPGCCGEPAKSHR